MDTTKRIFALGFFDGVHLGHQALLRECTALAGQRNCQSAAITFDRHPKALFTPEAPPLLSTAQTRTELLRQYGIRDVYTFPVVEEVMSMPWQDFLTELTDRGAAGFVCGHDFRFGFRGEGTAERLAEACENCVVVPAQTLDGTLVSSTHIRTLLESGQMEEACRFLGHPHILSGEVVHGRQIGRTIGIPTANLLPKPEAVALRHGVYACMAYVDRKAYPAVVNVGSRPTVEGKTVKAEAWLLDFDGDLYGKTLTLAFYAFLRPEKKFDSVTQLQEEILKNTAETRNFFEKSE